MAAGWKTVRVFISSTFSDMHAERDWLVKVVFPVLREKLEKHRIYLIDIDLRWGVTKEQVNDDRALDLCLQKIEECSFFIGILGERYGYGLKKIPSLSKPSYNWVQNMVGKSITELEIIHGVLNNHDMQARSFFYFRDKSFLVNVPDKKRGDLLSENDTKSANLEKLKQKIRSANIPIYEDYPCRYKGLKINWWLAQHKLTEEIRKNIEQVASDGIIDSLEYIKLDDELRQFVENESVVYLDGLKTFGQDVHDQLWESIQAEYNLDDATTIETAAETDSLVEEDEFHRRFMESRLRVYVGRKRDRHDLAQFIESNEEVACLVTGVPGSGKSTLLARVITDYGKEHPDVLILPHFIGASPASGTLLRLLWRLCSVLRGWFNFELEIPEKEDELIETFRTYLTLVPKNQRVLLVIDGINQLDPAYQAHELYWLPEKFPPHVKVIVSCTAPGSADLNQDGGFARPLDPVAEVILDRFQKRTVYAVEVSSLTDSERRQIIHDVPSLSAKILDETQVNLLLSNSATTNPLYLLVALEELRGFGVFEQLNSRIMFLPQSGDAVTALFVQVIERLEIEFGAALTRSMLTMLATARQGLTEKELLELIEFRRQTTDIEQYDLDNFYPLLRQLRNYLHNRGRLLDFYHRSLGLAIHDHYLTSHEEKREAHRSLADYFDQRELGPRKVDELPWQLAETEQWQRLYDLLANTDFFDAAWAADRYEVQRYWSRIETCSHLKIQNAYQHILETPEQYLKLVWPLGILLSSTGHPEETYSLGSYLVHYFRKSGDQTHLQAVLGSQAVILESWGKRYEAMLLYKEQEFICRALGNKNGLLVSLGNQAACCHARGELTEAMRLYKEQEKISRELKYKHGLQASLGNQALIFNTWGKLDEAMRLLKEKEQYCRELGNRDGLQRTLGNQGLILQTHGNLEEAMQLHKEQEEICRELGIVEGLSNALGSQGLILETRGELDQAMQYYQEQERISREVSAKDALQTSLGNQAVIHQKRGDLNQAMQLYKEQEQICREVESKDGLQRSLGNQGLILQTHGKLDEAMRLHKEKERICRELGNKDGLQISLGNQAIILNDSGKSNEAMCLHLEKENICRNLGNIEGLQISLGNQAAILQTWGEIHEAMRLYKEKERLCRELGNKQELQASLGSQGRILQAQDAVDEAMQLFQEQAQICRDMGNAHGLAESLLTQASVRGLSQNRPNEALPLAEEALRLAKENGLTNLAEIINRLLIALKSRIG